MINRIFELEIIFAIKPIKMIEKIEVYLQEHVIYATHYAMSSLNQPSPKASSMISHKIHLGCSIFYLRTASHRFALRTVRTSAKFAQKISVRNAFAPCAKGERFTPSVSHIVRTSTLIWPTTRVDNTKLSMYLKLNQI